jgi:hypothetical protein
MEREDMRKLAVDFLEQWLRERPIAPSAPGNVSIHDEREGGRGKAWGALRQTVADHFYDLSLIQGLEILDGYPEALEKVRCALPTRKVVRSGDLAEVLAAEYVDQLTEYEIPFRKLRYKDDRDMAMRLDDLVAIDRKSGTAPRVLKGEAKSRAKLAPGIVAEACKALARHRGRPSPQTLAFIARMLDEKNDDALAQVFYRLQKEAPAERHIEHLVFTLSGNDSSTALAAHAGAGASGIRRRMVGVVVEDHQDFIKQVFESI